jgi:hypothetical protein
LARQGFRRHTRWPSVDSSVDSSVDRNRAVDHTIDQGKFSSRAGSQWKGKRKQGREE